MTYLEAYKKCQSEEELRKEVTKDCHIALFFGNNPDRLQQILSAARKVADEHNWFNPCMEGIKYDTFNEIS